MGRVKNSSGSIQARTINTLALDVLPGVNYMNFLIGPNFQYGLTGQNTDPATVGDTNVKGSGWLLGLGTRVNLGMVVVGGSLDFFGKYSLSNNTTGGVKSSYSKPLGFRLRGGYPLPYPGLTADLNLSWHQYKQNTLGTQTIDIGSDKYSEWTIGVGVSWKVL